MEKSKLGMPTAWLAAILCLTALVEAWIVPVLLVAYVLIVEKDSWIKKTAVKILALIAIFWLAVAVIDFIPNLLDLLESFLGIFEVYLEEDTFLFNMFGGFERLVDFLVSVINVAEKVVFILLAIAYGMKKTVKIPVIDNIVEKNMD